MSDSNSSLPIRSESDGTDAKVVVKVIDGTNGGTNQMSIDSDKNAHVESHGNNPAGTDTVLKLSEQGSPNGDGFYDVSNNSIPNSSAVIAHTRASSPSASDQIQRVTAINNSSVHALDISLHDETGAAYSDTNPLSVTLTQSKGTEVNDYNTASAIAAGATSNHDYTVTAGKTLRLTQIYGSASGKLKIEIQIETGVASGTFNTKFVSFNSTANPNCLVPVNEDISVAAGVRVRVIRTNKDNQEQDLYSTISGHEV